MCDTFDREAAAAPANAEGTAAEREAVAPIRGTALLRLGRAADAASVLGECARLRPALLADPAFRLDLAVARAEGRFTVDPDYAGRHARDPRLADARRRLERAFPAAQDRVRRRLGLDDAGFPAVVALLEDAADRGGEREGAIMAAMVRDRGGEPVGVVLVTVEAVLSGGFPEERILAHEMTHVLGRLLCPARRSPDWVEEGLAHWVSEEEGREVEEYLLDPGALASGRPAADPVAPRLASVAALESGSPYEQRVAGMALFHVLERMRGRPAALSLAHRLLSSPDWRAAFAAETGGSLEALLPAAAREYAEWREEAFPARERLETAGRAAAEKRGAEALKAVEAVLAEGGRGAMRAAAEWMRARLLPQREGDAAAVEALRGVRRDHPFVPDLQVLARLDEGALLLRLGKREEAAVVGRELLSDWAWKDPWVEEQARRLVGR